MAAVLLLGGEAVLEDDVQTAADVAQRIPGRAEVQQLNRAVFGDVNVVWGHVPVDDALFVHGGKGVHDGKRHLHGVLPAEPPAVGLDVIEKTVAVQIFHDEIPGAVLLKIAVHTGDIGVADKLRHGLGFLKEAVQAVGKVLAPLARQWTDRDFLRPGRHGVREKFLDGNKPLGLVVLGKVSDTKAALTQHPSHDVATIENRPQGQRQGIFLPVFRPVKSAFFADPGIVQTVAETVVADIFHRVSAS